jgi:hypothetical protein
LVGAAVNVRGSEGVRGVALAVATRALLTHAEVKLARARDGETGWQPIGNRLGSTSVQSNGLRVDAAGWPCAQPGGDSMNIKGRAAIAGVLAVGGWTISGPVAGAEWTSTYPATAPKTTPAPPVDLGLASRIPAVDSYSIAEQEIDGNFQWAWGADDLLWVVRGTRVAEDYVRALLRSHAASLDPYDQQVMTGDLFDHIPSVPGFMYWDMPRAITLREVSQTLLGDCVERFYVGYVLPDGVSRNGQDDLGLALMKAAGWCVEDGLLEDVVAELRHDQARAPSRSVD